VAQATSFFFVWVRLQTKKRPFNLPIRHKQDARTVAATINSIVDLARPIIVVAVATQSNIRCRRISFPKTSLAPVALRHRKSNHTSLPPAVTPLSKLLLINLDNLYPGFCSCSRSFLALNYLGSYGDPVSNPSTIFWISSADHTVRQDLDSLRQLFQHSLNCLLIYHLIRIQIRILSYAEQQ
jgi:hypothetical protein